jgi:hypothetical protein
MPFELFPAMNAQEWIPEARFNGSDNASLHVEESAADHLQLGLNNSLLLMVVACF